MTTKISPSMLNSSVLETLSNKATVFDTADELQDAIVVANTQAVTTYGREAVGDGGGGPMGLSITEPDHPGKRQSADGKWWEFLDDAPYADRFLNIDEAAQWSAHTNRPVLLRPETVYVSPGGIVLGEGAKLVCREGDYNFVTRTISLEDGGPRQKGMARIVCPDGFDEDFITFGTGAYNALLAGVWIDGRTMTGGRVVTWKGADFNPRTQATLQNSLVWGYAGGVNVHVESLANEAKLIKVASIGGAKGFLFEGGDIEANFIASPYNTIGTHLLSTKGRLRSLAMESWMCDQNFIFEGAIGDADITSLIGDDSGQHGLKIIAKANEPAPGYTIGRLQISNSSRLSPGNYDDFYEDYTQNYYDAGYARILSANITGGDARHRINGVYNSPTFGALIAPTTFKNARLSSGNRSDTVSLASRRNVALTGWEVFNGTHRPISTIGSATGYHNLIANGDFDNWVNDTPLGIVAAGNAVLTRETNSDFVVGTGTALGITAGTTIGDGALAFIPNAKRYRGKVVSFTASVLNTGAEEHNLNTRAQIHVNGSVLSGSEQFVQSRSGYQITRVTALIPNDAESIACGVTPAAEFVANGRKIYTDKWAFVEGVISDEPIPANPLSDVTWVDYALTPFSGNQAAIDLRFCGSRTKLTSVSPVLLTGLVNDKPTEELVIQFMDDNVTIVSYSNINWEDGSEEDYQVPAGSILRFLYDGTNWIVSGGVRHMNMTRSTAQSTKIPANIKSITTTGYSVVGVGGAQYKRVTTEPTHAGKFRSTDRFLPDGTVSSGNGGWWELSEATPTVQMFGAVGDGVADDTPAMQAAHDTGKVIRYPSGIYRFGKITMASGGILGFGTHQVGNMQKGPTILKSYNTGSDNLIEYTGNVLTAAAPIFKDFSILVDSGSKSGGYAIAMRPVNVATARVEQAYFQNLVIRYVPGCIDMSDSADFLIMGCKFYFYTLNAVKIANVQAPDVGDSAIMGCHFFNGTGGTYGSVGNGIYQESSGGLRVNNCKFNGGIRAYQLNLLAITSIFVFTGNSVENCSGPSLNFKNTAHTVGVPVRFSHVTITGNEFYNNYNDVLFEEISNYNGSSYWDNIVITGNSSVYLHASRNAIELNSARSFMVASNSINGNSLGYRGIYVAASCNGDGDIGINGYYSLTSSVVSASSTITVAKKEYTGSVTGITASSSVGSVSGLYSGTGSVNFAREFETAPEVRAQVGTTGSGVGVSIFNITQTGFNYQIITFANTTTAQFTWSARGIRRSY